MKNRFVITKTLNWRNGFRTKGCEFSTNSQALGYHEHYLTEEEFLAIASREARSLAVWFKKSPQLAEVLSSLGFEPALPAHIRWKHALAGVLVNRVTIPALRHAARRMPLSLSALQQAIYIRIYQSIKRSALRQELGHIA